MVVPETKRRKTSHGESVPYVTTSSLLPADQQSSRQEGAEDEDSTVAPPVIDRQVEKKLRNLRDSKTVATATEAIKALFRKVGSDDVSAKKQEIAARTIVQWEGVGTILFALKDWHLQSSEFARLAIGTLTHLTYYFNEVQRVLVRFGGVNTMLDAAKKHDTVMLVRSNVVGLLSNFSATDDYEAREEVATEECIEVVLETMKSWPNDNYVQTAGCDYFHNISVVDGMKTNLRNNKKICSIFGKIIDNFFDSNDEVYEAAKSAFDMYGAK